MNNVILITGASSGIGKATATQLVRDGHIVYGAARRTDKMADIAALGVKLLQMDVTSEQSMTEGVSRILKAEGRIDVLVNNAGFGSLGAFEDVPLADARYQMEVNVFGAARLTQLVLPSMIERKYGKIVNVSSMGGKFASALGSWYHASKFALEALSDSLRNEVKQFGVDVIVIQPGAIKTEWSGIAAANLLKVSGSGRYKKMATAFARLLNGQDEKPMSDPSVIAKLIQKAIAGKKPKTRYAGGYMARPVLFLRRLLSDRMMDRFVNSQLKLN